MSIAHKVNGEWLETAGVPPIDTELSSTSTNAVQNRVVTAALGGKADSEAVLNEAKTRGALGAKNLNSIPYTQKSPITIKGITWTVNDDGSVTANGTNNTNDTSSFALHTRNTSDSEPLFIKNGRYIVNGCPSGGSLSSSYSIVMAITKNNTYTVLGRDFGEGVEITIDGDDEFEDMARLQIQLNVAAGVTVNNLTFYPMLRLATDSDPTYQPYAMTNYELTKAVGEGSDYYLEQQVTLSTSGDTIVTFTDSKITADSVLDVYTSKAGLDYKSISASTGSCSVTFSAVTSSETVTVRLYVM